MTILIFVTSYCFQFYLLVICKIPFTFAQRELFDISKAQRIGAVVMSLNRYQQLLTSLLTSVTQLDTIFFIILAKDTKLNKIKHDLHTYLRTNLMRLNTSFCIDPISKEDPRSALTKAEQELKQVAEDMLEQIYNKQKESVENNLKVLNEQIAQNDDKRKNTLKSLNQLRMDWTVIYNKLVEAKALLQQIETSVKGQ